MYWHHGQGSSTFTKQIKKKEFDGQLQVNDQLLEELTLDGLEVYYHVLSVSSLF
jgi:hypothetical protein